MVLHYSARILAIASLVLVAVLSGENTQNSEVSNVLTLLSNINSTTESSSYTIDSISDSISYITNSLEHSTALQALVNSCLSDIKVTIDNLNNRIQQLESKSACPSPYTLKSCKEIKQFWPELPSGHYTVTDIYGNQHRSVYCNMEELCGSSEGWTRIAYLNTSDTNHDCEQELGQQFGEYNANNRMACGKKNRGSGCISKTYNNFNIPYSKVCGKVLAYQYWSPDGIDCSATSIDAYYIDGVSLTYGSPRQHIWSFAGGFNENDPKCPCSSNSGSCAISSIIGNDYFCESGTSQYGRRLFTGDLLWDGQDCNGAESACCGSTEPWFCKTLAGEVNEDVELRLCSNSSDEDTPITYYEVYVQ